MSDCCLTPIQQFFSYSENKLIFNGDKVQAGSGKAGVVWHTQGSGKSISMVCYGDRGRFGALKSDSTHHFFRNACTKSGSLRFSQFSGC